MRLPYWMSLGWLWWFANNRWAAFTDWLQWLSTEPLSRAEVAWATLYAKKTVKLFDRGILTEREYTNLVRCKMHEAGVL